jgi:hypothetical protein
MSGFAMTNLRSGALDRAPLDPPLIGTAKLDKAQWASVHPTEKPDECMGIAVAYCDAYRPDARPREGLIVA